MSNVITSLDGGILTITIDRADKKNALTRDMYQSLASAFNDAEENDAVKVIKLNANGDCFTAGNDISDFANQQDSQHIAEVSAFMRALLYCSRPVVAQVHGMAVGIGTTLLLHCDLVYCEPQTRFVLPFVNLGLVPEFASSYILPRLAGHRKAAEWLMLGDPFDAAQASQFGLVNAVVDNDTLAAHVETVCQKLAQKPAFSLKHTKSLLVNNKESIDQHINDELDVFLEALTTEAAKEAFDAFLHKRPVNPEKFR
ncbi:enoyl-CoA hydratase [Salinimonas chungwhensis]|uniref:enoyl-CoA hydratase n=1 Tax=Salinimonas chungwhensis TaxID=265425 RepID=UPI00036D6194|nr:enoyl-CoA hydratase [Salinimonas chungwhensis]